MRPATRAGSASLRRRATPRGNNFRTRCLRFSTPRSTTTTSTSTGAHARARGVVSCDVPMPGFKRSRARARERREVFPSGAARERDGSEIVLDASARRVPRLRRDRRLRAEPGRLRASASPSPTVSPRAGARATLESRPPKSRTDPSALSSLALLTQARRAPRPTSPSSCRRVVSCPRCVRWPIPRSRRPRARLSVVAARVVGKSSKRRIFLKFFWRLPPSRPRADDRDPRPLQSEWRGLGVQQSRGWVHYAIHRPEPHIMLYRCERRSAALPLEASSFVCSSRARARAISLRVPRP